ncbi:hypothetical protein GCM10008025_14710 [Ornithinibacillus halotolerans]|uniref:Uncharacterized protein n=1 Tax=Ornithinibacillus halotolerans TaxID=1274357 RepID=A0A916RVI1_9BACI|nr:hypothetical protein GCM10008025_14710 [Ornithinibacillus halotolerans]
MHLDFKVDGTNHIHSFSVNTCDVITTIPCIYGKIKQLNIFNIMYKER